MNKIVGACALSAQLGLGCAVVQEKPVEEPIVLDVHDRLEDLLKGTYFIEVYGRYVTDNGVSRIVTVKGGTGFAYRKNGEDYILTAAHITSPDTHHLIERKPLPNWDIDKDPLDDGFEEIYKQIIEENSKLPKDGAIGTLESSLLLLAEDYYDDNILDDIPLTVVKVSIDGDWAVLKSEEQLHVPEYRIGNPDELRLGEEVYTIGYPNCQFYSVQKASIANLGNSKYGWIGYPRQGNHKYLQVGSYPGQSGAPYFRIADDGVPELMGICKSGVGRSSSEYLLCSDIDQFEAFFKE